MKRIVCIVICFSLFLLSSCTPIPSELPEFSEQHDSDDADVQNALQDAGYRDICFPYMGGFAIWDHWALTTHGEFVDLTTYEMFSACNDPLCAHSSQHCAQNTLEWSEFVLVSPNSTQDDLIFYIQAMSSRQLSDGTMIPNKYLARYHYYTGEIVVLYDNLTVKAQSFGLDPATENLFVVDYINNDEGETERAIYIINGKTGKRQMIDIPCKSFSIKYAIGDILYCMDSINGTFYQIDLSVKEPVWETIEMINCIDVSHGYAYYLEKIGEEQLRVPDDIVPLCEQYGKEPVRNFESYNLYRVNIMEKNAHPELVAEGVTSMSGCVGNYVCYYEYEPKYLFSYFSFVSFADRTYGNYRIDDPNIPANAVLFNVFSENVGALHILDADTLEPIAVIDSEQYAIKPTFKLSTLGIFVDFEGCEVEHYLSGSGTTVIKAGYIPFAKGSLTDEDVVPIVLD
ncbi:MAG: hypothetical protein IJW40_11725 [Clostridia bacterium]|nr:hypothetical protein [Clostridia bacterium]MBQ7339104.1 hypothetical protein [Clostridia bacterium]